MQDLQPGTHSTWLDTETPEDYWVDIDVSGNFDAIPGPSYTLDDYSNTDFLYAVDGEGNDILCYVSHWLISCNLEEVVEAEGVISFSVILYNGQSSGSFSAYITDGKWGLLYQPVYSSTDQKVSFKTSLKNSIDLYFPAYDGTDDSFTVLDFQLQAFIPIEAKKGESLSLTSQLLSI